MVKSNIAELDASTSSGGTLTVDLSVSCPSSATGCNVSQIGNTYYLYPVLNGYYPCGLRLGNQSVQYTWTLNVSATPTSLASGVNVFVEFVYTDTLPNNPSYTVDWVFTLDSNGQASQSFGACITPVNVFPESGVGVRVTGVKSASGQPISYTSSAIGIVPED